MSIVDDNTRRRLAALPPEQQRLLAQRLRQARRPAQSRAPLSYAQERLWFVDRLDPGSPAGNVAISIRITGALDVSALRAALNAVVARQGALRTVIVLDHEGEPEQLVRDTITVDIPTVDIRRMPAEQRSSTIDGEASAQANHTFDLTVGPLLAGRLLILADTEHLLLLSVHHIVFDGWSSGVFLADLVDGYHAATGTGPSRRPRLATHFADHARTERAGLGPAADLAYWRRRLTDAPALSTLPPDRPRPSTPTRRGQRLEFAVPADVTAAVVGFARRTGVTLNAAVLATFAAVLGRAAGQDEVLLGVPVAGRTTAELEPLVGCFANTLVIRVDLTGQPSARELAGRVHRSIGEASAHQSVPYAHVVEAVAPQRDPRLNPLFQVMVSVAEAEQHSVMSVAGATFELVPSAGDSTDFDAFVTIGHVGNELRGVFRFNPDLYLEESIETAVQELQRTLRDVADDAGGPLVGPSRAVTVMSSFTAEPIRASLKFWSGYLRMPVRWTVAAYGQLIQHLLADADADATVVLLRWQDWLRHASGDRSAAEELLDGVVEEIAAAIRAGAGRRLVVVVGPSQPGDESWLATFDRLDDRLARLLADVPNVQLTWPGERLARWRITELYDREADRLGHVPYTDEGFAMLGTVVARLLARAWHHPIGAERTEHLRDQLSTAAIIAERARAASAGPPPIGTPVTAEPVRPPQTPMQHQIAAIWREQLGVDEVGIANGFFALGGHSLLATRMLSRVHREFGRDISLAAFFRAPTIEQLANAIESGSRPDAAAAPPLTAASRVLMSHEVPLRLSSAQERLWALSHVDGGYGITFAAELRGPLDEAALRRAVDTIVARHEVLRTVFAEEAGRPVPVIQRDIPCWLADLNLAEGSVGDEQLGRAVEEHGRAPYDLATGPLLRLRLCRAAPGIAYLLIGMHHTICDDTSWGVFFAELSELYRSYRRGEAPALPELAVQYTDYAHWQRAWLSGPEAGAAMEFWRRELTGAPAALNLPTDHPRNAERMRPSARAIHLLPADLGADLRELCRGTDVPLFTALIAGVASVLHDLSGQDDLVLGVPTAHRDQAELANLIGCFADTVPLRLHVDGRPTFRQLLRRTHEAATRAYEYQRVPLASIVEAVRPRRELGRHPLFQCMASFVDQVDERPARPVLDGVELRELPQPANGIEFDLFVNLRWRDGRLAVFVDYAADLFDEPTVRGWLTELEAVLRRAVNRPDDATGTRSDEGQRVLTVGGSFDISPVQPVLGLWCEGLQGGVDARIARPGRAFPTLLEADDDADLTVLVVRLTDWLGARSDLRLADGVRQLESVVAQLTAAARSWASRSPGRLTLVWCPSDPLWTRLAGPVGRLVDQLTSALAGEPRVEVAPLGQWLDGFGVGSGIPVEHLAAVVGTEAYRRTAASERSPLVLAPTGMGLGDLADLLRDQVARGRQVLLCADPADGAFDQLSALARLWPEQVRLAVGDLVEATAGVAAGIADGASLSPVVVTTDPAALVGVRQAFPATTTLVGSRDSATLRRRLSHVWPLDGVVVAGPAGVRADLTEAAAIAHTAGLIPEAAEPSPVPGAGEAGDVVEAERATPADPRVAIMTRIWADLLRLDQVDPDDDFFEIGGDSMLAIQVAHRAGLEGLTITPRQVVDHVSIAQLCAALAEASAEPQFAAGNVVAAVDAAPLTAPQSWFMDEIAVTLPNPAHFNHPYYLNLRQSIASSIVERAIELLAERHAALRLSVEHDGTSWRQRYAAAAIPFESHDFSGLPSERIDQETQVLAAARQAELNLSGPLARAVHMRLGDGRPDRLLLINHHLVTDGLSRGILLADLRTLCHQLLAGTPPSWPTATTPYLQWAGHAHEYAQSSRLEAELPFWLNQLTPADDSLPVDLADRPTRFGRLSPVSALMTQPETDAVRDLARRRRVRVPVLLLWAVARAIADWSGARDRVLMLAGNGREPFADRVDLSRTVGWFQVFHPLRIRLPRDADEGAEIAEVNRQLSEVPGGGVGYGLLRYVHPDNRVRQRLATTAPLVSFNYSGNFSFHATDEGDDLFDVSPAPLGRAQDPDGVWPYRLDVSATTVGGRLRLQMLASTEVYQSATMQDLATAIVQRLSRLAKQGEG